MRSTLEKRDCARFQYEAPVVVEECGTGRYYEARMYNYSLLGMYFESDLYLLPGARVNLWITDLPENSLPDINSAEVRWTEEIRGAVVLFSYGAGVKYHHSVKQRNFPRQIRLIRGGTRSSETAKT